MATSPNFSWPEPDNTDLVKNGALAIRTAVDAIDSSMADLKGGTTGQVLSKASNTDMDFTWTTDAAGIPATILDAKGDIIAATAADTATRLAVGTNGQVLTADSTASTGIKWATPAGGGKILQVVEGTMTSNIDTSSTSFVDVGLSASITPSATTSKIYAMVTFNSQVRKPTSEANNYGYYVLLRNSTQIAGAAIGLYRQSDTTIMDNRGTVSISKLDAPSTTSSITYKVQYRSVFSSGTVYIFGTQAGGTTDAGPAVLTLWEVSA